VIGTEMAASKFDPYSEAALDDPFQYYEPLRVAGPVVHLEGRDIYALPRYHDVRFALRDWETYSTDRGVFLHPAPNRYEASVISAASPPEHTRIRQIIGGRMTTRAIAELAPTIRAVADRMIEPLVESGTFEVTSELAAPLTVAVMSDFAGLPDEPEQMPRWADACFDMMGPESERTEQNRALLQELVTYAVELANERKLEAGHIGAEIFGAVERGELEYLEAVSLFCDVVLVAGMDTTLNLIGSAVMLFVQHPDQWDKLVANPELAQSAVEEVMRFESPIQNFFRRAVRDAEIDGSVVPEDARVMLMYGSANRDPRRWKDADRFDIERNAAAHVGFGHGIHVCLGAPLARLEARAVLEALARRVTCFALAGTPVRKLNSTVRGYSSLPVSVETR